jgi:hypothetical protein
MLFSGNLDNPGQCEQQGEDEVEATDEDDKGKRKTTKQINSSHEKLHNDRVVQISTNNIAR